jgi:carboxymethylenebutenolidase
VRFEYRDDKGRMRSLLALPKEVQDELHANMTQVTDRMAMADIGAVLKFLGGEPVRQGPKGTIGYCLGGRLSLAAAAEFPDQFRASASMHGTRMVSDKPDSCGAKSTAALPRRTISRRPPPSRRWASCSPAALR